MSPLAIFTVLLLLHTSVADPYQDYVHERAQLIEQEASLRFDANITLSVEELEVEAIMLKQRALEIQQMGDNFAPALNFVDAKPIIDQSPLLAMLRSMPKGAILHAHTGSVVDMGWVVSNVTYRPDCFIYYGPDPTILNGSLNVFLSPPPTGWSVVNDLRQASGNITAFDEGLRQMFVLGEGYASNAAAWEKFGTIFDRLGPLSYRPVFEDYLEQLFQSLTADNVQYIELRVVMGYMWDEQGPCSLDRELLVYRDVISRYQQAHADFAGAKVIYCALRSYNHTVFRDKMMEALDLYQRYPDLMIGFDVMAGHGGEDAGETDFYFAPDFLQLPRGQLPLYLHGGESYWATNENLVDLLLLGARRIGHGFALDKHPLLMQMVKQRGVGIEVSPISNQELVLEHDMRNHPASVFVKTGVQFSICFDDPAVYGYNAVSYDFWEAFMSWDVDLSSLKQLAYNSITFSGMTPTEQAAALDVFEQKWKLFISTMLSQYA